MTAEEISTKDKGSKLLDNLSTYTPLILSLFYFLGLNHPHVKSWQVLVSIALYLVHLKLYQTMARGTPRYRNWAIVLTMLMCFASTPINSTSYAFYWYVAYFAALQFSLRVAFAILATVLALVCLGAFTNDVVFYWFFVPALIPSIAMFGHGLYEKKSREFNFCTKKSQEEITQLAKVAERERIARDLHDVMGHNLATIALKAQLAEKQGRAGKIDEALKEIAAVSTITSQALAEMRAVITGYRFRSIEHHVHKLVRSLEDANFHVINHLDFPDLGAKVESTIALVLTEAVTNILKHSKGDEVRLDAVVQAGEQGNELKLSVFDNGRTENLLEGNGMQGMRERIAEIGGKMHQHLNSGVEISFIFPLEPNSP